MAKFLVIVESPAKAKTINRFLGRDYSVKACFGAVRDLPKSEMGVNIEENFEPKYVTLREERTRKAVKEIKLAAEKADKILLASDPDREGEAIAWHVAEILKANKKTADKPCTRVVFNEITKKSVKDAVANPREINADLVNAQQARRIVDRLVGYKLSPLLGWMVRRGLSAGRVQSVTVRMVVEREQAIRAFVPEEYWTIEADLLTERKEPFRARLFSRNGDAVRLGEAGQIHAEAEATTIVDSLQSAEFHVKSVERKEVRRRPSPPFITSSLQQEASRKLGMSPAKTMAIAQQLYQGIAMGGEGQSGLITYMRTDSFRLSGEFISDARNYIEHTFSAEMLPEKPNFYRSRKSAQDAHEAIRPSDANCTPDSIRRHLSQEQYKLYSLIWKRSIACQMPPAVFDQTTVDVHAAECVFRATGTIMKFPGFTKLYEETVEENGSQDDQNRRLPEIGEGEHVPLQELVPEQHFTKPPPRFSEASLVRAMEENGIGRPSTYAPTIKTVLDREYVAKEKGRLVPTELGEEVNEWLVSYFPDVLSIDFTARLEESLDEVEDGKQEWRTLAANFYGPFEKSLKITQAKMVAELAGDDPRCPQCDAPVELKESWFGLFLGCTRHPDCKGTLRIERKGTPPPEPTDEVCEECSKPMVIRTGRYGRFLACTGYPKCKVSHQLDKDGKKRAPKPPARRTDQKCPTCKKGVLLVRTSRKGEEFYGCEKYPKCRYTKPMELDLKCPLCEGELEQKMAKRRRYVGCANHPKCDFTAFGRLDKNTACSACSNSWTVITKPRGKPHVRSCPVPTCKHEEPFTEEEAEAAS